MTEPGSTPSSDDSEEVVRYPGARRPDRRRSVESAGLRIAVYEWGDPGAPPLLLAHGGFDFVGTFDVFAPLLADAGWRVVSWDQRGHGDSDHAPLYSWDADLRDLMAVLDATSRDPLPAVAHSKGGGLVSHLMQAAPHRFTHFVNVDGLPTPKPHPDVADRERSRTLEREITDWLDHRARAAGRERKPGTLDELAQRRRRMNPRLSLDWLRYLVTIGARRDPDGWRWKIDPTLRFGGFGPWRPSWSLERLPGLAVPMLGIIGLIHEEMGWGATPDLLAPWVPTGTRIVSFEDAGHFVHIEKPAEVAELTLEFLS